MSCATKSKTYVVLLFGVPLAASKFAVCDVRHPADVSCALPFGRDVIRREHERVVACQTNR